MGRKPSPETSPEYGSYLVSLLYRLTEALTTSEERPPAYATETLENTLQSTLSIPEVKEWAITISKRIDSMSEQEWRRATLSFITRWAEYQSNLYVQRGEEDPFRDLSLHDKAEVIFKSIGWQEGIDKFLITVRQRITDIIKRISLGDLEELQSEISDITEGLFSIERAKSIEIIKLSLLAYGDDDLVNEVDQAIRMLREKLRSSPELAAAVETVEKDQGWGGRFADQRFRRVWDNLQPKAMGRIKSKRLSIPSVRYIDRDRRDTWDEETSIAMTTIYNELVKRASTKPAKLLEDALKGKLANSLVMAVEDKIKDKIRHEKAQKRDYRKRDTLEEEEERKKPITRLAQSRKSLLDLIIAEEDWTEIVSGLEEDEKTVLTMIFKEGFNQREVARKLGKSQPWVSKKYNAAIEKLRQKRD